jgi:hypothetical protein
MRSRSSLSGSPARLKSKPRSQVPASEHPDRSSAHSAGPERPGLKRSSAQTASARYPEAWVTPQKHKPRPRDRELNPVDRMRNPLIANIKSLNCHGGPSTLNRGLELLLEQIAVRGPHPVWAISHFSSEMFQCYSQNTLTIRGINGIRSCTFPHRIGNKNIRGYACS